MFTKEKFCVEVLHALIGANTHATAEDAAKDALKAWAVIDGVKKIDGVEKAQPAKGLKVAAKQR
jgi:hypothetical protein